MKTVTREQAIDDIRVKLLTLVDDEHSICEVASRLKILCHGYSQWTTGELRKRHGWIVAGRPAVRRPELEDLANRWQLARQYVLGTPIACDTQACESEAHHTCGGWREFDNAKLEQFYVELVGEGVVIASAEGAE